MLNLRHQLLLALLFQNNYFHIGKVLVLAEIWAIVSLFQHKLELVKVTATLELGIGLISKESLSQTTADGFWIAIVHVEIHYFWA